MPATPPESNSPERQGVGGGGVMYTEPTAADGGVPDYQCLMEEMGNMIRSHSLLGTPRSRKAGGPVQSQSRQLALVDREGGSGDL